jgi:hypothetical protein
MNDALTWHRMRRAVNEAVTVRFGGKGLRQASFGYVAPGVLF